MLFKIAENNWKMYSSVWRRYEILRLMLHKDVLVLAITDGILCESTIFCLFLQRAIRVGYLQWNNSGWIIQTVCFQPLFITLCFSVSLRFSFDDISLANSSF